MLSPHEIATLLLAAASLGPIDADALEPPDLAALAQARLVHVAIDEGQTTVIVTEDGRRVLRRLGLERSGSDRAAGMTMQTTHAPRLMTMANAKHAEPEMESGVAGRSELPVAQSVDALRESSALRSPIKSTNVAADRTARETVRETDGEIQQAASLPADASDSEHREEQA